MLLIGHNIKVARRSKRLSQSELSKLCGWSHFPSRISNYERGIREPKGEDLVMLSKVLGVTIDWLYRDHSTTNMVSANETTAHYHPVKYVPILESQHIEAHLKGQYVPRKDMMTASGDLNDKSFAMIVKGDSMEAQHGPSFPQDSIIFVDPNVDAENHDYVIAEINEEITFKQLTQDSGQRYLKPLNPRYPVIEAKKMEIIGVVRSMTHIFK